MDEKKMILDACCGSRMFWFDKTHPNVLFQDIRDAEYILCDGRKLEVHPDVVADFTAMPYPDRSFNLHIWTIPMMGHIWHRNTVRSADSNGRTI